MGERRHQAVDEVLKVLSKASRDLAVVQRHLDLEFQRSYPDHGLSETYDRKSTRSMDLEVNPCKIVARIKKIQEELVSLKELCRELLAEKQDLIDKARTILVGQRSSLQRLLASSGLPLLSESDDIAYTNLNQVIDEWTAQVRGKTGDEKNTDEDINQMLFSAIVQNS